MNRSSFSNHSRIAARLRCLAGMLGLVLAAAGAASAQTGPVVSSPGVPTPYQSPLFHSGGALTPATLNATLPFFNPLYGQGQGTPTEVSPQTAVGVPTYIPSFLLGAYDPTRPPTTAGIYYPEHFADGDVFAWQAPFDYTPNSASAVAVDDSSPAPTGGPSPTSGFMATSGFLNVPGTVGTPGDLPAGTATNGEYARLSPGAANTGTATWTLVAQTAGNFSVYFHIPDNIADSFGAVETRSTSVEYAVTVSGASAQTIIATVSQTEANADQYLAGPFQLAVGDTVTVRLNRDTTFTDPTLTPKTIKTIDSLNQLNIADYLIADSMTLQATIGDVRSTPTAINYDSFLPADFAGAKYWGIYTPAGGTPQIAVGATAAQNAIPDTTGGITPNTTPIFRDGSTTLASDAAHRIRQLVYFGRSEPTINYSDTVDNSDAAFSTPTGTWTNVTDATATNGAYIHVAPVILPTAASATAQWTLTAPNLGNYYVSVHLPQGNIATETRITDATYHVTYGAPATTLTVQISQAPTGAADSTVLLPTGPLALAKGDTVTVTLDNTTALGVTAKTFVVADSVTLATGNGQGAIYCVDGFTGGVLWRFQTPGSPLNGPSAPVFSAPAVAKINVMTAPGVYANKLVVIVGDDNGMVYCLDAIGNGDGTSNANVLDPNTGQPITIPQPVYGSPPPLQVDAVGYTPHVGTTSEYWIYRPDPRLPKNITTHAVKAADPNSDLPVPAAFGMASPTIFVDPSKTTTPTLATDSNAIVYVGNSNGVLYALDPIGTAIDGTSSATYQTSGDTFNVSLDLRNAPGVFPVVATDAIVPTCQPLWWFTLRGANPNLAATSADIESAPTFHVTPPVAPVTISTPTVYIGSAHEQESTSNIGRLYALNGLYGPSGNGGLLDPRLPAGVPGSLNYNLDQRPTLPTLAGVADTADWTFPDRYGTQPAAINSSQKPRPALGNVTGSPIVFTNFHETGTNPNGTSKSIRIYFAANVGLEIPAGSAATVTTPSARPDDTQTGRIWAVNLDGSVGTTTNTSGAGAHPWAYPLANDPNNVAKDTVAEPFAPVGSFLHTTPAIGFVQFPNIITAGTGAYAPADNFATVSIKGQSVPMLYFGTRGVDDTELYAVDIDGDMAGATDQRTIYHELSPDGAIFQASPILITNSTTSGGNGGSVLIVGGDTLYDFSATPISNPDATQPFPLIREDKALVGFGPLSSPAVAAANVNDLTFTGPAPTNVVTDWVYVGDSSTGLCRGITPQDSTDNSIPSDLGDIVPPNPNPPVIQDLTTNIQTYLVNSAHAGSTLAAPGADALPVGLNAPLPVYEWGENVYIRLANVVPPNPATDVNLFVHDGTLTLADFNAATPSNPITFYSSPGGQANGITFALSDATAGSSVDRGSVPPVNVTALPADGFIARTDPVTGTQVADSMNKLVDGTGKRYIGAYTYAIGDGTARRNTPGGRRRIQDVTQTVSIWLFTNQIGDGNITEFANFAQPTTTATTTTLRGTASNGNVVSVLDPTTGQYKNTFNNVAAVDQPTFGILNPLGIRAGGIPLSLGTSTPTNAVQIGDELGPFRGTSGTVPVLATVGSGDFYALQALANGNSIYQTYAPPSSSGVGVSPVALPAAGGAFNPNVVPQTVVTSTGLIPHNSSGDNSDSTASPAPPSASYATNGAADEGVLPSAAYGSVDRPYSFDIFDRSALSLVGKVLKVKMGVPSGGDGMFWNDNTTPINQISGHDAVVNYLPWETTPTAYKYGSNSSPDYPDIAPQNITLTLHANDNGGGSTASLSSDSAVATPATGATGANAVRDRTVYGSPVQVHIDVPNHQPANQQLYSKTLGGAAYNTGAEVTPKSIGSAGDIVFPMGYVTTKRIYVPNQYGRYDSATAYRDVSIYTGVPISMATSMADGTVDVGKAPAAFGSQTEDYVPLGQFTPYTPAYQSQNNYLPLTIHNDGNVNLLNVHLDQRQFYSGAYHYLTLISDTLEPLSVIPGFDSTGFTSALDSTTVPGVLIRKDAGGADVSLPTTSVPEFPFLVRSSLDTDLVAAFGRNPNVNVAMYPGATFHKALAGSASPTTLTVPDVPNGTVPGFTLTAAAKPTPGDTSLPYVGITLPFGTPVGTYHQTVRLFEGMDISGYSTYINSGPLVGAYSPYYPPQYGGAVGGQTAPSLTATFGYPTDILQVGAQPISDPGVILRTTALESRMTDGFTYGSMPQVDAAGAGTGNAATPDFAPAAFRDWTSEKMSVYWTSGRDYTAGTTVPFDIYGMNVNYANPAFLADATGQTWWSPISTTYSKDQLFDDALPAPTHSGLTIVQDQPVLNGTSFQGNGGVFAFDVAVSTPPYQNNIYCYPVTGPTGAVGTGQLVSNDPSQIKYGVHGLYVKSANPFPQNPNLWAFWTASTRGRTAIYYNSTIASATSTAAWPQTTGLLPVPAGLTAVADPAPVLLTAPAIAPGGGFATAAPFTQPVIEVTFSGTAPDGNTDLYECRYAPTAMSGSGASQLGLVSFPTVTEQMTPIGGWYQARDLAWSRAGVLNLTLTTQAGSTPILYDSTGKPLFTKAVFDKASGLLVLTGVTFTGAAGGPVTVYIDGATGRVRFTQPPPAKAIVTATFNPLARRITVDPRSDVGPVTFLDPTYKENDAGFYNAVNAAKLPTPVAVIPRVQTDRRWYVWRKSGATGDAHSATLYYKTQRLTFFLPTPIALNSNQQPIIQVTLAGNVVYDGTTPTPTSDIVDVDWARGRIYFPIDTGGTLAEGQQVAVTYTPPGGASQTIAATPTNTIQWQDEQRANDSSSAPPTDSASGLATTLDYAVPIDTIVNESNVAAFLDTDAYRDLLAAPVAPATDAPHKAWLFWNSTRNGTSDLYYETINPRFSVGP